MQRRLTAGRWGQSAGKKQNGSSMGRNLKGILGKKIPQTNHLRNGSSGWRKGFWPKDWWVQPPNIAATCIVQCLLKRKQARLKVILQFRVFSPNLCFCSGSLLLWLLETSNFCCKSPHAQWKWMFLFWHFGLSSFSLPLLFICAVLCREQP